MVLVLVGQMLGLHGDLRMELIDRVRQPSDGGGGVINGGAQPRLGIPCETVELIHHSLLLDELVVQLMVQLLEQADDANYRLRVLIGAAGAVPGGGHTGDD